jgi:hypothetical protein
MRVSVEEVIICSPVACLGGMSDIVRVVVVRPVVAHRFEC